MPNICVIPARGGSKRIPGKNIKDFLGEPIIAYSIKAAIKSGLFDEVMVSTDDMEIAKIAESYGANVPFLRSDRNSDDFATTVDVLLEVIESYSQNGKHFEFLCCIYPSAPFTTSEKLHQAYTTLKEKNADTVFPIIPFSFPIQRAVRIEEDRLFFIYPEFAISRSQDLPLAYHDAGQFYFVKIESLKNSKAIVNKNTSAIIISELEAQDIDNETDWKLAELKYYLIHAKSK